jgi:hypothetical protein
MPPSNAGYYIAAYVAAAAVYLGYGLSIAVRMRRLRARQGANRANAGLPT